MYDGREVKITRNLDNKFQTADITVVLRGSGSHRAFYNGLNTLSTRPCSPLKVLELQRVMLLDWNYTLCKIGSIRA